ncbi:MAG: hypothetical protein HWE30_10170, partial [Methylocystaceae bacterium]|nr:hypothetical protein [Methylocystaceae bacterium]
MTTTNSTYTSGTLIFSESFEESGITGSGFQVFDEADPWNTNDWDVETTAGIEIQNGNVGGTTGGSDGTAHAELDTHGNSTLSKISKIINTPNDTYTLTFDYMPRPANQDDSDMKVYVGEESFVVSSDNNGVVSFVNSTSYQVLQTTNANGWTTFTVVMTDTAPTTEIAFEGLGTVNNQGAYLDAINVYEYDDLTAEGGVISVNAGDEATWHLAGSGDEGLDVTFSIDGTADAEGWIDVGNGKVKLTDSATGEYQFIADETATGNSSFTYTVTDDLGQVTTGEMVVDIGAPDDFYGAIEDIVLDDGLSVSQTGNITLSADGKTISSGANSWF